MDNGRIPKDILYAELSSGKRQIGHPQLRFKDVGKNDLRCFGITPSSWENLAQDRPWWQQALRSGLFMSEVTLTLRGPEEISGNKTPAHEHLQGQPSHATYVV